MKNYTYFLTDGVHVKIGCSIRPHVRAKQCGIEGVTMLFALLVTTPNSRGWFLERAIHRHFQEKRVKKQIGKRNTREWFDLSGEDLEQIKSLSFMSWNTPRSWSVRRIIAHSCGCHPLGYGSPRRVLSIAVITPEMIRDEPPSTGE